MATITFEGHKFTYDEKALTKYSVMKAMTSFQSNPEGFFWALEQIFKGKDAEYAALLDDSTEKITELLAAIMEKVGEQAKN